MPRKKLTPQQAKAMLMADGMDFQEDFHALGSSAVQALADVAKLAGYRKRKNAPGSTVRMFYQYLSRVEPVVRAPGQLTSAERRAYQVRARKNKKKIAEGTTGITTTTTTTRHHAAKKKSPAQLDREIADALAPSGSSAHSHIRERPGGFNEYRPMFRTGRGDWTPHDHGFAEMDPAVRAADAISHSGTVSRVEEHAYNRLGQLVERRVVYRSRKRPRRYPG